MNLEKYIVKARPGVVGGKFEEKRPLRERIELPVKRHIFINRDSHPDADIYVAIHEAKICRRACRTIKCPTFTTRTNSTILSAIIPT